ncbi:hypothetical protein [Roseibium sediminicola]|uniref:Uncharacterized protein n=1 Tax=Roseibium sediminicola TaxID=2933272 RepID=A0ABT0H2E4_9HYPH|nr:hypothetical protein [Roseibium sp. CAU 1639]MCK7615858.1 hypothetical protein [Roseibium sp. CAU 1639]
MAHHIFALQHNLFDAAAGPEIRSGGFPFRTGLRPAKPKETRDIRRKRFKAGLLAACRSALLFGKEADLETRQIHP